MDNAPNGKHRPGLNFTTDEAGDLCIGFHMETFLAYFSPKVNRGGWINLKVKKLPTPVGKYTHGYEIVRPDNVKKEAA